MIEARQEASARKPYVSETQLSMYCKCPEQYRRRYIEGEKIPPNIAMVRGIGFHTGVELNMRQKVDSRIDLPPAEIVDASVSAFEDQMHGEITFTAEQMSRGKATVVGETIGVVARLATVHAIQQAPDYQPILVEFGQRVELPDASHDLFGYIDLVDEEHNLTDFKTAAKRKSESDAATSTQLTVYASLFMAKFGTLPKQMILDTAIATKTKSYRQKIATTRDASDFEPLSRRITAVLAGINQGNFPPTMPGAWWCSDDWCGYWRTCPYVNSKRGK